MSEKNDYYPENHEDIRFDWTQERIHFIIIWNYHTDHYCGYCIFPKRPVKEPGYNGILRYVPVHGGITYDNERSDGTMCYGFDCGHIDSPSGPTEDWLTGQCEMMADSIKAARRIENQYLLAEGDNDKRAGILTRFHKRIHKKFPDYFEGHNFGIGIALLSGQL